MPPERAAGVGPADVGRSLFAGWQRRVRRRAGCAPETKPRTSELPLAPTSVPLTLTAPRGTHGTRRLRGISRLPRRTYLVVASTRRSQLWSRKPTDPERSATIRDGTNRPPDQLCRQHAGRWRTLANRDQTTRNARIASLSCLLSFHPRWPRPTSNHGRVPDSSGWRQRHCATADPGEPWRRPVPAREGSPLGVGSVGQCLDRCSD